MSGEWLRFWDRESWASWRADRKDWVPYRKDRNRARIGKVRAGVRDRKLNAELRRVDQALDWVRQIQPRELPIRTARGETGLAVVPQVNLREVRRRNGKDVWTPVDTGSVYFTDKKMVFSGTRKDVRFVYDKTTSLIRQHSQIEIRVSNRKRPHALTGTLNQLETVLQGCHDYADGLDPADRYVAERDEITDALAQSSADRATVSAGLSNLEKPKRPISPAWLPGAAVLLIAGALSGNPSSGTDANVSGLDASPATTTTEVSTTVPDSAAPTTATSTTTSIPDTRSPDAQVSSEVVAFEASLGEGQGDRELQGTHAYVESVTDGDTIVVQLPSGEESSLRLIGVDAPESGECIAGDATARLVSSMADEDIVLVSDVSDTDRYGRLLRYVWVGDEFVNESLVRSGMAIARRYPPDTLFSERLLAAQRAAQEEKLGIWAPDACGAPADVTLTVASVHFDAAGDDNNNLNDEYVIIANDSDITVDLGGWTVRDESASHRYTFPAGFALFAGETVRLNTGCGEDTGAVLYWCNEGSAVWNNDGDSVFVDDPNGSVNTYSAYAPVTTTTTSTTTTTVAAIATTAGPSCHPSYTPCVPIASDVDCIGGSGNGPEYVGRVTVIGPDVYRLDNDGDGIGCDNDPPWNP